MPIVIQENRDTVRLTEYSHGAGCGCKIAPEVLSDIIHTDRLMSDFPNLKVGKVAIDDNQGIISTTDFFMPIVDDPFSFGQIAAANAISDIYAMGGTPLMAIAILGWPINKLGTGVAKKVIDGGREICLKANIPLAGGHSIDAPEPIFGLAVTGKVDLNHLKQNNTAKEGDLLFITKPLGIGILSTAQKQKKLFKEHAEIAPTVMKQLNVCGAAFAKLSGVHAMTDVTGFGLMGHLLEMCTGSQLHACIVEESIPFLEHVEYYREQGCVPGGAQRNYKSYNNVLPELTNRQITLLCDPQTSGGLLIAVSPQEEHLFLSTAKEQGLTLHPIGSMVAKNQSSSVINVL